LERTGLRENTVVIISADHGGAGLSHGPDDARSRHIPWIATGPGVRRGFDLTRKEKLQVNTEDTCATACWLLGLALPAYFDGKALREAFESRD
jgi:arylsulfatase A-like enzyme